VLAEIQGRDGDVLTIGLPETESYRDGWRSEMEMGDGDRVGYGDGENVNEVRNCMSRKREI
jgi:hypothetical protein